MRSEFKLTNGGLGWELRDYTGQLIYASLNPRAVIRQGKRMITARLYNWHHSVPIGDIVTVSLTPGGAICTATIVEEGRDSIWPVTDCLTQKVNRYIQPT